jgi:hypothetical protein
LEAAFAPERNDRKSITGFAVWRGRNIIAWASRKQKTIAVSSMEAEFVAASEAIMEKFELPEITILQDNVATAINLVKDGVSTRLKHVETRWLMVKEYIKERGIKVLGVSTEDQPADILTKRGRDRIYGTSSEASWV